MTLYSPDSIFFPPIVLIALKAASFPASSGLKDAKCVLLFHPVPLTFSSSIIEVIFAVMIVDSSKSFIPFVLFIAIRSFRIVISPPTIIDFTYPPSVKVLREPPSASHPRLTVSSALISMTQLS